MGRESTKHNPRIDDQLKHETDPLVHGAPVEGHAREDLQTEAPTEGQPVLDLRQRPDVEASPNTGVSQETADDRADLAAALAAAKFPARRDELIADAEESFASESVMTRLRELPADREFPTVQSVWATLGGEVEARHP